MLKFREIIRLHELGRSQSEIAQSCAVARSTVQDYLRRAVEKGLSYEQLSQLSDSEAQALLGKGKRQSITAEEAIDFTQVHKELQRKGVTLMLLWQEGLDSAQWQCGYSSFCRRYKRWRARHNLSMRQDYKGGEKLFVDYCGPTLPVIHPVTGEVVQAQIFVACLGASNYTFAEATPTQELPHWIGSHQRALIFFGGVPKCIVPDNLKTGVTDPCRYEPGVNRTYQEFAEHYGVSVIPTRPRKPRDKSKVEKAVQEVERQILAPLRHQRFSNFGQLNRAIKAQLKLLNDRQMKAYGLSRRELFEQVDQGALQPLPTQPFVLAKWKTARVSLDYHVEIDRRYYSVPYWFVQREVMVKASEQLIEVFYDGKQIACHERCRIPYHHTTLPEHMPPEHWAYKRQSKASCLAWAERIGPHTTAQVTALFESKAHEEQAFRSIKGLQRLAQKYGKRQFEAACRRANSFAMVGVRRIRAILEAGLEEDPSATEETPQPSVSHPNLRGQQYFQ